MNSSIRKSIQTSSVDARHPLLCLDVESAGNASFSAPSSDLACSALMARLQEVLDGACVQSNAVLSAQSGKGQSSNLPSKSLSCKNQSSNALSSNSHPSNNHPNNNYSSTTQHTRQPNIFTSNTHHALNYSTILPFTPDSLPKHLSTTQLSPNIFSQQFTHTHRLIDHFTSTPRQPQLTNPQLPRRDSAAFTVPPHSDNLTFDSSFGTSNNNTTTFFSSPSHRLVNTISRQQVNIPHHYTTITSSTRLDDNHFIPRIHEPTILREPNESTNHHTYSSSVHSNYHHELPNSQESPTTLMESASDQIMRKYLTDSFISNAMPSIDDAHRRLH